MTTPLMNDITEKRFFRGLFALSVLAFFLRAYGLSSQPPAQDDIAVGFSAVNFVEAGHLGPTMWNHPVLRNILVYLSLQLFENGIWGLKFFSLTFGALSIPLLGMTARRFLAHNGAALIAAFFLAIDPLHIDYSRQAIQETYMAFFTLAGVLMALKFRDTNKPTLLLLSGISFGLGLASKWYVAFPLFITAGYLMLGPARDRKVERMRKITSLVFITSSLFILPFTVYMLTFTPWFLRGYDISDWLYLQKAMSLETVTHRGYNPFESELDHRAYLWFVKPVSYADFILFEGKPTVLLGIANPIVWLLTIPSTLYVFYMSIKKSAEQLLYLSLLFYLSYIPFLISARPIWAHTAFSVLPFGLIAVAYSLVAMAQRRKHGRLLIGLYLMAVILSSMPLYLSAIGQGLEIGWLSPLVESYRPAFER